MAEPDDIDSLIREIASENRIALDRGDPVLVVHTLNKRLIRDLKVAQEEMVREFKQTLEGVSHRLDTDATGRAEKILNASLRASSEAMDNRLMQAADAAGERLRKHTNVLKQSAEVSSKPLLNQLRLLTGANLVAAIAILTGGILSYFGSF